MYFFPPSLFSSLCLSRSLNVVPPTCAHCSLDSLAGSTTGTQHSCLLCCITHCLPVTARVCFPVHQTIVDERTSLPAAGAVFFFFFRLSQSVVTAETLLHIQKLPYMSFRSPARWVAVACHTALVSPQWLTTLSRGLPTDRCWLTNQQLSTTNLCCGPFRLTAFCVAVSERNR